MLPPLLNLDLPTLLWTLYLCLSLVLIALSLTLWAPPSWIPTFQTYHIVCGLLAVITGYHHFFPYPPALWILTPPSSNTSPLAPWPSIYNHHQPHITRIISFPLNTPIWNTQSISFTFTWYSQPAWSVFCNLPLLPCSGLTLIFLVISPFKPFHLIIALKPWLLHNPAHSPHSIWPTCTQWSTTHLM